MQQRERVLPKPVLLRKRFGGLDQGLGFLEDPIRLEFKNTPAQKEALTHAKQLRWAIVGARLKDSFDTRAGLHQLGHVVVHVRCHEL